MAEGFARHFSESEFEVASAGTKPALSISGKATKVMAEEGIDISSQYPKPFTQEDLDRAEKVILMGCKVECPNIESIQDKVEDWGIDDPIGQPIEYYIVIKDEIKKKVLDLLVRLRNSD